MNTLASKLHNAGLPMRLAIGAGLAAAVASGDYATGTEISFSIFYLFPVGFVTWFAGRRWGLTCALFCTGLWLANDLWLEGHVYSHPLTPIWNAIMRGGYFSMASLALTHLQASMQQRLTIAELKNEMLAVVSHEFGNHLTVMDMALILMREDCAGENASRRIELCGTMGRTLGVLKQAAANFLNAARMESGKFALNVRRTELRRLVNEVVDALSPLIDKKEITVRRDFPPHVIPLLADPDALALVLSNLIGNAVKYTPPKGNVTISLSHQPGKKDVLVTVEDTGIGITKEDQKKIFSGFYRTKTGTAAAKGYGIGLKISKDILESHGSHLEVASEPGSGSSFHFRLPIMDEPSA
jgi:signal transduction histidine kinase